MNYLDIHSHILPSVDDGAKSVEAALQLLEATKQQGVTHIVATPHFYPDTDSAEDFAERVSRAFAVLCPAAQAQGLPKILLGCELHYFSGIGKSRSLRQFAIKGTNYLLLELPYGTPITQTVLQDIIDIREHCGLTPILAHIERYAKQRGYKKLLRLIASGTALGQINADAVISKEYVRLCERLIKGGYVSFLASDCHSSEHRPPLIGQALEAITERLGKSAASRLIIKSNRLLEEIEGDYAQ